MWMVFLIGLGVGTVLGYVISKVLDTDSDDNDNEDYDEE